MYSRLHYLINKGITFGMIGMAWVSAQANIWTGRHLVHLESNKAHAFYRTPTTTYTCIQVIEWSDLDFYQFSIQIPTVLHSRFVNKELDPTKVSRVYSKLNQLR